jgi:hypothetical protein
MPQFSHGLFHCLTVGTGRCPRNILCTYARKYTAWLSTALVGPAAGFDFGRRRYVRPTARRIVGRVGVDRFGDAVLACHTSRGHALDDVAALSSE